MGMFENHVLVAIADGNVERVYNLPESELTFDKMRKLNDTLASLGIKNVRVQLGYVERYSSMEEFINSLG